MTRRRVVTVTVGWAFVALVLAVVGLAAVNRGGVGLLLVGVLLLTAAAILWWPDRRNR